jgi:hypothetical protein
MQFGFSAESWGIVASALRVHAEQCDVARTDKTEFGVGRRHFVMKELDTVVLTTDLSEHRLKKGDVGTIVLLHGSAGYEVEFMTLAGDTIVVVSLLKDQVRPVGSREVAQARAF